MTTNDLRKIFLEFFKQKGHTIFKSDTLVPDDPTVFFTSAGMNQFKPYFLGQRKEVLRAASCQKCLRTDDLEKVGLTQYHHTFFEMLGNFSFGDYFKKEAIEFAWEFITKELQMKEETLWVSVYADDTDAYNIWESHIGLPCAKIVRLSQDKNFWPASAPTLGPNGPCGPCSEIFFDRGKDTGCGRADCGPACECGRFVEFWNLVFTQFNRVGENQLEPLPQKNIDTGMGLERMASILQGKDSNFEIDILHPVVEFVRQTLQAAGCKWFDKRFDFAQHPSKRPEPIEGLTIPTRTIPSEVEGLQATSYINAIVDHTRAAVFAITDGVIPSNEERGYVVRKLIRTALWKAHLMGAKQAFLHTLVGLYVELMKEPYPELLEKKSYITQIIVGEEEKFLDTLKEGKSQLAIIIDGLKREEKDTLSACAAFRLYDTYGFPLELSKEIAKGSNLKVDESGFSELLKRQRELSRKKSMFDESIFKKGEIVFDEKSEFIGHESLETEVTIVRLLDTKHEVSVLRQGQEGLIIFQRTPFYPESGGQLSDRGLITTNDRGTVFEVEAVFKINEAIVHRGRVIRGELTKVKVQASVDKVRRQALMRAHTATHLLQAALRSVLGSHIMQQGSLVDVDRLRFDFTHPKALSDEEVFKVEDLVNEFIFKTDRVEKKMLSFEEAKREGALAFFKDKYKDTVRVVSIGNYSKELCGGTHLDNTSNIGAFIILSESSISSGLRRIEAVVGKNAYEMMRLHKRMLSDIGSLLKCSDLEAINLVEKLQDDLKKERQRCEQLEHELATFQLSSILSAKKTIQGVSFLAYEFKSKEPSVILYLSDLLRKEVNSLFLFLTSVLSDRVIFLCSITADLVKKGLSARWFVTAFKDQLNLRGGGKDTLAQGIMTKKEKDFLKRVEDCFVEFVKANLKKVN